MGDDPTPGKILIIEDDPSLQKSLAFILEKEGFDIYSTNCGEEGIILARKKRPDLIILDLVLPGIDGFKFCHIMKKDPSTSSILILMLTGKRRPEDIVLGLREYADDYVVKPFEPEILIARIYALLRRKARPVAEVLEVIEYDGISIRLDAFEVHIDGRSVNLTKTEFDILALLAGKPNYVFTRSRILDHVREDNYGITERIVDYQITGIRKKLGAARKYIKTVRGVGYKFSTEPN